MKGISSKALGFGCAENRYKYNGKEEQRKEFSDGSGLEWLDFGARMYDDQIGRWDRVDQKSEFYFATSPYVYALNQPINAIDPNGQLVIFINGNHFGDGGKPEYWRAYKTNSVKTGERPVYDEFGVKLYSEPIFRTYKTEMYGFDENVMDRFNDHNESFAKTSLNVYKDGGLGGWFKGMSSAERYLVGYEEGEKDAETIISNLSRDKNGNIVESIKIFAHSMGGTYAKGYISALIKYANKHPEKCNGLKITEYDFAIFQPDLQHAIEGVVTRQFVNKGDNVNKWYFGSSNNEEQGADSYKEGEGGHSIIDFRWFFDNSGNLVEGTYVWDSQQKKFIKK